MLTEWKMFSSFLGAEMLTNHDELSMAPLVNAHCGNVGIL